MVDPKTFVKTSVQTLRRGVAERRPLVLIAVGVVAAIVLLVVLWRSDDGRSTGSRKRLVDLDPVDLEHLAGCLAPHQALLESFGYALPDPA